MICDSERISCSNVACCTYGAHVWFRKRESRITGHDLRYAPTATQDLF